MSAVIDERASERTERSRMEHEIRELEQRLAEVEQRSAVAPDPAYMRTAAKLRRELDAKRSRLAERTATTAERQARRNSPEAEAARAKAIASARKFEKKLAELIAATVEAMTDGQAYEPFADCPDREIFPRNIGSVIRGIIIYRLGMAGRAFRTSKKGNPFALQDFATQAKPPMPLDERY